jgi:hypothetical protein
MRIDAITVSVQWPDVARLQSQLRRRIQVQLAAMMLLAAGLFALAWVLSIVAGAFVARNVYLDLSPTFKDYTGSTAIVIDGGRILFTRQHTVFPSDPTPIVIEWTAQRLDKTTTSIRGFDAPRWLQAIGIDWRWRTNTSPAPAAPLAATAPPTYIQRERHISVPFWLLIVISATAGWLLGRRNWIVRRHVISGQCPACGYDVRATPDHCPECGFAAATPATSAGGCPMG